MMLASFMFTVYSDQTEKPRRMTDCTHIHQPRRKTSWQNACAAHN